jgi:putative sterol carrier protein
MHTTPRTDTDPVEGDLNVEQSFGRLARNFQAEQATGLNAVIQYEIEGERGGTWNAVIEHGTCAISPGPGSQPTLTLQVSAEDWLDIFRKKHSPYGLFLSGRMKVRGDIELAVKLRSLFPRSEGTAGPPPPGSGDAAEQRTNQ